MLANAVASAATGLIVGLEFYVHFHSNFNATYKRLSRSYVSSPFVEVASVSCRALLIPSRTAIIYHGSMSLSRANLLTGY